jgi:uncharacterized damage-inducible protein DinB
MKQLLTAVLVTSLAGAGAYGQAASDPLSNDARASWKRLSGLIARAAEKMPEENYAFKPTPEVRSFGQMVAHVADGNYLICGAEAGEQKRVGVEKSKTAKADIIAALAESVTYCDARYTALTDSKAGELVKFFGREQARLSVLRTNIEHDMEHYGNLVTYLRMKGIVPPSSEPRP